MESVYESLTCRAHRLLDKAEDNRRNGSPRWRSIIALAGPPGSGKSTIAAEVVQRLNARGDDRRAVVVPMDGFHYPRSVLDKFPNAKQAHERRGAEWTFDADGVISLFNDLHQSTARLPSEAQDIYTPSFDHVAKDPVKDDIVIYQSACLVIIEGNWLLYDQEPWRRIRTLVDEAWFVNVDVEMARNRIASRHLKSGIESTWEAALRRADNNDIVNGEEIRKRLVRPDVEVWSVDVKRA
ncbi:hypothetical protein CEP53_013218 [Fusarium sp. AF-6]|nr:hypothetical protein CEP53_013218 [Fusarium sp. AF-6]